ncbi:MAG: penicillin-binding protein 2 [Patescibacteria group bacterium]|jgi:penicillin-binding protein 2|nr:penicillin-binding protein 2 [Patescibacteria group bacterium]
MNLFKKKNKIHDIDPDEIFIDTQNLSGFDVQQFEGRIEKPISKKSVNMVLMFFVFLILVFSYKLSVLQIKKGEAYFSMSQRNSLDGEILFADRGIIYDRNGVELAWNEAQEEEGLFGHRTYIKEEGFGLILGYVDSPKKDKFGFWWQENFIGKAGLEKYYDEILNGQNGSKFIEKSALGEVVSENIINKPVHGENLNISIDSRLQAVVYDAIVELSENIGYDGGAGVIMDVRTGEILVSTSYPEYDPSVMSLGSDREKINSYLNSTKKPFLNRVISGLYSPGSTVKPFVAIGALHENIITENTRILSTGFIEIPNPYNPELSTKFRDWREEGHGNVNVVRAIGDSVNTFFYAISGGYKGQPGLGISKIEEYMNIFGIGQKTGVDFEGEVSGTIPNPEWKKRVFKGDAWRLGDTYNTSIGQYGFQVTPIQMVRSISTIANEGVVVTPSFSLESISQPRKISVDFSSDDYRIIKDGMRDVVAAGTGQLMNVSYVDVAAKTGTAQTGPGNRFVNSWSIGFFPYENPKYAFAILMEKGPAKNELSASFVMRKLFDWMNQNTPEYFQ